MQWAKNRVKIIGLLGILVLTLSCSNNEVRKVTLFNINELKGNVMTDSDYVGVAYWASYINRVKKQNPSTLVVATGNSYNGKPMSNSLHGYPVSVFFKRVGVVASNVNSFHFHWGTEYFTEWCKDGGFTFIAANILKKRTTNYEHITDGYANAYPISTKPYIIVKTHNGVKVALIGVSSPNIPYKTTPDYVEGLAFTDPVKAVIGAVASAKKEKADIIVVLADFLATQQKNSLMTLDEMIEVLPYIEGIDAIITGSLHSTKAVGNINNVPILQSGQDGEVLGKIEFSLSPYNLVTTTSLVFPDRQNLVYDEAMVLALNNISTKEQQTLQMGLGYLAYDLDHSRYTLSPLGQTVATAVQQEAQADMAFVNGGGYTDGGLKRGFITRGDLKATLLFEEKIVVLKMTGYQIKEVLHYGLNNQRVGYLQYSGLLIDDDDINLNRVKLSDGRPLENEKLYTVATQTYLSKGGDSYSTFPNSQLVKELGSIEDAFIAYQKWTK